MATNAITQAEADQFIAIADAQRHSQDFSPHLVQTRYERYRNAVADQAQAPEKPWKLSTRMIKKDKSNVIDAVAMLTGSTEQEVAQKPVRRGYDFHVEIEQPEGYDPSTRPTEARVATGLTGDLACMDLYNYRPQNESQRIAVRACWRWLEQFDPDKRDCGVPGLNFYSPANRPGVGKTHLVAAIGNYLGTHGFSNFKFCTLKQILAEITATFHEGATETTDQVRRRYGSYRVILLDDVGKEPVPSGWARAELFELFDTWINNKTRILRTGNLPDRSNDSRDDTLESRYGRPALSRLFMLSNMTFVIDGEDQRMVKNEYSSFFQGL